MENEMKSKSNMTTKLLASACAAAVAAMSLTPVAYAAESTHLWNVPTTAKSVTDAKGASYVTSAAHRVTETYADVLGISNVTVCNSAANGLGLAGLPTAEDSQSRLDKMANNGMMGLFATDANANPNPYLWNLFYNQYADVNGKTAASADQTANVIWSGQVKKCGPTSADTQVIAEYGTSTTLDMRPDILLGFGDNATTYDGTKYSSYAQMIKIINSWKSGDAHYKAGDETYNPKMVQPNMSSMYGTANTMYALAEAADSIVAASNGTKTLRYGDATSIAKKFESFIKASQLYVLSQIADGNVEKKTVGYVRAVDNDTHTITFLGSASTGEDNNSYRQVESSHNTVNNIVDVKGYKTETIGTESNVYAGTADDVMDCDVIICCTSNVDGGGGDGVSGDEWAAKLKQELEFKGKTDQSEYPSIYTTSGKAGCTLDRGSADSIINYALYLGFIYPEVVNPIDLISYFYENFYHISSASLSKALENNMSHQSLPAGTSLSDVSKYSSNAVEQKLAHGWRYYLANKDAVAKVDEGLAPSSHIDLSSEDIKNLSDATVTVKNSTVSYSGKALKPAVTVKLYGQTLSSSNYKVSYKNNNKVGTATVTVSGTGAYSGSSSASFSIAMGKAAPKVKVGSKRITVSWKSTGASKYKVSYRQKGAKSWKSISTKKTTATISKLKAKKKYQVRVISTKAGQETTTSKIVTSAKVLK